MQLLKRPPLKETCKLCMMKLLPYCQAGHWFTHHIIELRDKNIVAYKTHSDLQFGKYMSSIPCECCITTLIDVTAVNAEPDG